MWAARSLLIFLLGTGVAAADANAPVDPSIDSLPGATGSPAGVQPATTGTSATTTTSSSSSGFGAQTQQNTTTAMKTFQNLTYQKLSQSETAQAYSDTSPSTTFSFDPSATPDQTGDEDGP